MKLFFTVTTEDNKMIQKSIHNLFIFAIMVGCFFGAYVLSSFSPVHSVEKRDIQRTLSQNPNSQHAIFITPNSSLQDRRMAELLNQPPSIHSKIVKF